MMNTSTLSDLPLDNSAKAKVLIYTTQLCGFCRAAKQLLASKNVEFKEIPVDGDRQLRQELTERSGQRTVPQIWVGQNHVGGFTDLAKLEQTGELESLLEQA